MTCSECGSKFEGDETLCPGCRPSPDDPACSGCGTTLRMPFQRTGDTPLYCMDCYRDRAPRRPHR